MPKTTIEYDIPKKAELAAKFAEEAQYSENGLQVTVGRFIAKKSHNNWLDEINIFDPAIGFKCIDTQKQAAGLRADFFVSAPAHPDDEGKILLRRTDQLENVVPILAQKEAELQLTDTDRQRALIEALKSKTLELEAGLE